MPHVIEQFPNVTQLAAELGGILFTPSVFVNCLISSRNRASLYHGALLNILGRSPDFMIKGYMLEIDKKIVKDNLDSAKEAGYVTPEKAGIIEGALKSLKTLRCSQEIEVQANERSSEMSLYDARRLEAAFYHNLTIVTSEPEDFTSNSDELDHIFRHQYADVAVGFSEEIDLGEPEMSAKVWIFKPEALATVLNYFNPSSQICHVDRRGILVLQSFEVQSSMTGSHASVGLLLDGIPRIGATEQEGPIDAVLRAVENALEDVIDFSGCDIHQRVSDTTSQRDSVRVRIRFNIPEHYYGTMQPSINCFESADESQNMLHSTVQAYVNVLNTFLKYRHPPLDAD